MLSIAMATYSAIPEGLELESDENCMEELAV
jgi:hypothetical protein